jgi:lipoate---protein ligase
MDGEMHGEYKVPGGKLVVVDCMVRDGTIASVEVTGDFFLYPDTALDTVTNALTGLPASTSEAEIATRIRAATGPDVTFLGFSPEAIATALRRAMRDER